MTFLVFKVFGLKLNLGIFAGDKILAKMQEKGLARVYVAMFFAVLFWGFSFIWTKQALGLYRPVTIILFRLIFSVIFLYILGKIFGLIQKLYSRDIKSFVIVAFWEPFAYFLGENFGLTHVSSTTAAVIIATIPLFSPIAAYFYYRERISLINFAGILISIFGVFLVVLKPNFSFKIDLIGLLLMLWAVFSAIFYSVYVLKISKKYNVYTIIFYQNLIGSLMFLPVFLIVDLKQFLTIGLNLKYFIPIIELSIFASTLAFMFFTYGIKHLGIIRANLLANTIPIFTAFFSYLILGERFTWFNVLGIFIVIAGVTLGEIKSFNHQKQQI